MSGHFQILGAGAVTCQKYLDASDQDRVYAETWWAGYVTAINRTTEETWNVVGKKSASEITDMLRKECSTDPSVLFAIAVHNVLEELYKTRTKLKPDE